MNTVGITYQGQEIRCRWLGHNEILQAGDLGCLAGNWYPVPDSQHGKKVGGGRMILRPKLRRTDKLCTEPGCPHKQFARGKCGSHYNQLIRPDRKK